MDTGEVTGFIFLRKTERYYQKRELLIRGVEVTSPPTPPQYIEYVERVIDDYYESTRRLVPLSERSNYMAWKRDFSLEQKQIMELFEKTVDELGIQVRYVPNKKGGYKFVEGYGFVKERR